MAGVEHTRRVLVVDDEPDLRELLGVTLEKMGLETLSAAGLAEAKRLLVSEPIDLVLTDMRLGDGDGMDLVAWMQQQAPGVPVAMITAFGSMDTAVQALKAGAFDFVAKPVDLMRLRSMVRSALALGEGQPGGTAGPAPLLGEAPAMHDLRALIARVARSQAPVLITGESGTGKELVARLIHGAGTRGAAPFVPVNCGAIPAELMESELFGHRRGSFTGATADRPGLILSAEGGSLFLDEIGELPMPLQVKLLRVIQERAVRPVGGTEELAVDVRFLSATHRNLERLVSEGKFREDLYYRLDVISLHVPPLRERREDIPLLAEHLLERMAHATGGTPVQLSPEALEMLRRHDFPGNVRELENVLERALALCESERIRPRDIRLRRAPRRLEERHGPEPLPEALHEMEREAIEKALREAGGNRTEAARRLGMTFRQLRYRIAKLGIES